MNLEKIQKEIYQEATEEVHQWFNKQCIYPYNSFYLYYDQYEYIKLLITDIEPSPAWVSATPQRIMPNWTKEQAIQFVIDTVQKLPILNKTKGE